MSLSEGPVLHTSSICEFIYDFNNEQRVRYIKTISQIIRLKNVLRLSLVE